MRTRSNVLFLAALLLTACGKPASSKAAHKATGADAGIAQSTGNAQPAAAGSGSLLLTWDAATGPAPDTYRVFAAESASAAEQPILQLAKTAPGFDQTKPSVTISTADPSLKAFAGKQVCLSVSAVVAGAESAASVPLCVKL